MLTPPLFLVTFYLPSPSISIPFYGIDNKKSNNYAPKLYVCVCVCESVSNFRSIDFNADFQSISLLGKRNLGRRGEREREKGG